VQSAHSVDAAPDGRLAKYGWVIVAVCTFGISTGPGAFALGSAGQFIGAFHDEFGWDRGMTAGAFSFGFIVSAALSPSLGRLMDRRGPRILLQVLVYPVTNHDFGAQSYVENATGYLLTTEDMRWFWRHYLSREEQGQEVTASPMRAKSLADLPPALVMTAGCDPLRDEGDAYAARLRDSGVPVTVTQYPGMFHGFMRMTRILDQARAGLDEVATALRKALA